MRIEVDDAQEFGFPLGGHSRSHPGRFARREDCDPTLKKAFEDALDRISAAEDNRRNLGYGAPVVGEKHDLGAVAVS
jgi:hypothetical protein